MGRTIEDECDQRAAVRKEQLMAERAARVEDCCFGETVIPGLKEGLVIVVAATNGSNISWLLDQPYEAHVISDFDRNSRSRRNVGREGAAYTRYIIDNYDHLPPKLVFLHDHRQGWETNDQAGVLNFIDKDSYGYMGLSKKWALNLNPEHIDLCRWFLKDIGLRQLAETIPTDRYQFSFTPGGAFLVSSERIHLQGWGTWQRAFQWLQLHPHKDYGMALEFTWHLLFGEPANLNPPAPTKLCPGKPEACQHTAWYPTNLPSARLVWYNLHNSFLQRRAAARRAAALRSS